MILHDGSICSTLRGLHEQIKYRNEIMKEVYREKEKMDKNTIIEKYGKKDGYDEDRFLSAINMSGLTDNSVMQCFISLINLEEKGFIKLVIEEQEE